MRARLAIVLLIGLISSVALAFVGPTAGVVDAIHASGTAVGPGFVESWAVTCAATATEIVPTGLAGAVMAFECAAVESSETSATVKVGVGDSAVADPDTATRNSPVLCGSGCAKTSIAVNARQGYCRADSGTVPLYCWAIVAAGSAP